MTTLTTTGITPGDITIWALATIGAFVVGVALLGLILKPRRRRRW